MSCGNISAHLEGEGREPTVESMPKCPKCGITIHIIIGKYESGKLCKMCEQKNKEAK